MRTTLICILVALFIASCDSRTYMEEDFYDTVWENSDGSKATAIELHKDGTCDVKNLDWDIIYPPEYSFAHHKNDYPESFHGYWSIDYDLNGHQCIEFGAEGLKTSFRFDIEDIHTLRRSIGDPDLCDYYILKRTNLSTGGIINGHDWVDMGTGVKWATTNVGSATPKGNGDYFAWGEVSPAPDGRFSNSNCRLYGDSAIVTIVGDAKYDAARANWGSSWRMPTREEWRELMKECEWKWYGSGYQVTAKNGNVLYLPAAGSREKPLQNYVDKGWDGYYWSSATGHFPPKAWALFFNSRYEIMRCEHRSLGCSIRPVSE